MGAVCCKCVVAKDELTSQSLEESAELMFNIGKYDTALKLYKQALELNNIVYGEPNIQMLKLLQKVAITYEKLNNFSEAKKCHQTIVDSKLPPEEENMFDWSLSFLSLGRIFCEEEKYQEGLDNLQTCLAFMRNENSEDLINLLRAQIFMGKCLLGLVRYQEAKDCLEKVLSRAIKARGEECEEVAMIYETLADLSIMQEMDRDEQEEIVTINPDGPGLKILFLQRLIFDIQTSKKSNVAVEKAKDYLLKALRIRRRRFGRSHIDTAKCQLKACSVRTMEEARDEIKEAVDIITRKFGEDSPEAAKANLEVIRLTALSQKYDIVKEKGAELLWTLLNSYGQNHFKVGEYYKLLGEIAFIQTKYAQAHEHFSQALDIYIKCYNEFDPHVAECYENMALCCIKEKRKSEAAALYSKALQIKMSFYGSDHIRTKQLRTIIDYWERFGWVNIAEDITERYSKGVTSRRTQGDLSFMFEETSDEVRFDDGRYKGKCILTKVQIIGDSSGGSASAKTGCEDALLIMPGFTKDCHFFAVIDGHGPDGRVAAEDTRNHLYSFLKKHSEKIFELRSHRAVEQFLRIGIANVEHILEKNPKVSVDSGCCCLGVFIQRGILYTINVGDCKAILVKANSSSGKAGNVVIKELSKQHRAIREEETQRISARGGRFDKTSKDGSTPRIWQDQLGPGISATRVLGNFKAKSIGLISEPEIESYVLTKEDKYIIAATDGLWDVMSAEEVVDFVEPYLEKNGMESSINSELNVAQALVAEARKKWEYINQKAPIGVSDNPKLKSGYDDITVIIASLIFE